MRKTILPFSVLFLAGCNGLLEQKAGRGRPADSPIIVTDGNSIHFSTKDGFHIRHRKNIKLHVADDKNMYLFTCVWKTAPDKCVGDKYPLGNTGAVGKPGDSWTLTLIHTGNTPALELHYPDTFDSNGPKGIETKVVATSDDVKFNLDKDDADGSPHIKAEKVQLSSAIYQKLKDDQTPDGPAKNILCPSPPNDAVSPQTGCEMVIIQVP